VSSSKKERQKLVKFLVRVNRGAPLGTPALAEIG
jgi:hypothetical protein